MKTNNYQRKLRQLKNAVKELKNMNQHAKPKKVINLLKAKVRQHLQELSFVIPASLLKKAFFIGATLVGSSLFNSVYSQNFQTDSILIDNVDLDYYVSSKFVDMDSDGDLDLIACDIYMTFDYYNNSISHYYFKLYENQSTSNQLNFVIQDTIFFNIETYDVSGYYRHSDFDLKDLDNDGDLDFTILAWNFTDSYYYGTRISYNLNIGTPTTPNFEVNNMPPTLADIFYNGSSASAGWADDFIMIDIDHDDDLDVFFHLGQEVIFYENNGTSSVPDYLPEVINPFGISLTTLNSRFKFIDINQDGDYDLITGDNDTFIVSLNNGSSTLPDFTPAQVSIFNLILESGNNSLGEFVDFDHDGDIDFLNEKNTDFTFYQNIGTTTPNFANGIVNPFNLDSGQTTSNLIQVGDLEGDGDLDVFLNQQYSLYFIVFIDTTTLIDNDNDGFNSNFDCDDSNLTINPGATEICDGIDNNCDGNTDEGYTLSSYYSDIDGDSFGTGNPTDLCTDPGAGYSINNTDCDDFDPNIYEGAEEILNNGIDEDCDGSDLISGVGINENSTKNIQLFPNPGSDKLTINLGKENKYVSIKMFNSFGAEVISLNYENSSILNINTKNLLSGVYFIEIGTVENNMVFKWVKN